MENGRKTPSVIARLMGIDETPTRQQPVLGQQRVLSKNYLQKSASIGKRSRKDLSNSVVGSKKRANLRTNKDSLSRDFERKSLRFDGMQGVKSPVVFGSDDDGKKGKLPKNIVLRPNLGSVQRVSGPSFLLDSQSVFGWEAKKQLLERHKMRKVSQQLQPDFVKAIGVKNNEAWNHEPVAKLPIFKGLDFSSNRTAKYVKAIRSDMAINTKKNFLISNLSTTLALSSNAELETKNVESFHGDTEDKSNCSMNDECSSGLSDLSSEEGSPIRSHEDDSVSSNGVHTDEEHSDGKVESYQHSPNSVLETPFREDNSSSSECFARAKSDLRGLWKQLQLLKSESEENDNKPEEMVTSSDSERSTCTDQNTISTILSGSKESRDFSYLVDVLNESGFQDGNIETCFKRWHSAERMTGPSVFETLEKKYGKQELWHKAERRLLFDRINSGMTEIVRPRVDIRVCAKPLRRKMRSMLRRDVIEEELSALLRSQEKGVDDGVSEKAVGRGLWFDPVDELDSLVTEIEIFLFDKLAGELVSA